MVFQEKLLLSKMEFPATHCFDEKTGVGFSRSFPDGGGKPSVLFYLLLEALGVVGSFWHIVHFTMMHFMFLRATFLCRRTGKCRHYKPESRYFAFPKRNTIKDRAKRDPRKLTISFCPLMQLIRNRVILTPSWAFKSMDTYKLGVVTHLFPGVYFLPSISQRTVYFPRGPFISQKGPFISQGGRLFPKSKNDK